jgi:preprotein translocase subunit SecY
LEQQSFASSFPSFLFYFIFILFILTFFASKVRSIYENTKKISNEIKLYVDFNNDINYLARLIQVSGMYFTSILIIFFNYFFSSRVSGRRSSI